MDDKQDWDEERFKELEANTLWGQCRRAGDAFTALGHAIMDTFHIERKLNAFRRALGPRRPPRTVTFHDGKDEGRPSFTIIVTDDEWRAIKKVKAGGQFPRSVKMKLLMVSGLPLRKASGVLIAEEKWTNWRFWRKRKHGR